MQYDRISYYISFSVYYYDIKPQNHVKFKMSLSFKLTVYDLTSYIVLYQPTETCNFYE